MPTQDQASLLCTKDVLSRIDRRSPTTLWRQVRMGQFPRPTVKIAGRYPYWSEATVSKFLRGEWQPEVSV
jgi:predicted DNA-binding transcriptional regulator AlpA